MIKKDIAVSFYVFSLFIIHVVYVAVFLGVFVTIPEYVRLLNIFVQVFLCLILMIRFHPFRENHTLQSGDSMFIFGAGVFLFTNVVLVELSKLPIIGIQIQKIVILV